MKKILPFILIIFCANFIFSQKLFTVTQNNVPQEKITRIINQVAQENISLFSLTRNNEKKEIFSVPISSTQNTQIIILNEETGNHVMITPVKESCTEFQLSPFFIEELKLAALGEASRYLIVETWRAMSLPEDFSVQSVTSVSRSNEEVFLPRYFYGKKEDVKEALPKERQIIGIYKQKPQIISAYPDNFEHQRYIEQLEEEMSYYVYMYKLPDGTLCTYDEHFNPTNKENRSSIGNFLEFILTGELTETQRTATEFSLELWSEQLAGSEPVYINVDLYSLGQGVLGMTFFPQCFYNPSENIWYPSALWRQLVGYGIPWMEDISIVMNSDYGFYYRLDGNTNGMDFVTIMIHEITHGLGFGCYCNPDDGDFFYGAPGTYDCQLYQGLSGKSFIELSPSERAALMVSNNLYAGAPNSNLIKANNGVRVKMYAPPNYSPGSSAHHWDNNVGFINFMQYAYQYPLHTFNNRKIGILKDMGWTTPVIDPNAVWVTFCANGANGSRTPQPFSPGIAQNLKMNIFYKPGYVFLSWNTLPDGTGTSYQDKAPITLFTDTSLYALWEPGKFLLTFHPNGGTVSPTSKQVVFNSPIGELPIPHKKDYKFDGWTIGALVFTEDTIWKFPSNNTLVAKWSKLTGIDESLNVADIQIFPNPTTGELRIETSDMRYEISEIEIYDMIGRKLISNLKSQISSLKSQISNQTIDISHLSAGIYFLKIQTEKGTIIKKIIKL